MHITLKQYQALVTDFMDKYPQYHPLFHLNKIVIIPSSSGNVCMRYLYHVVENKKDLGGSNETMVSSTYTLHRRVNDGRTYAY
jgi:hypothetical protein